MEERRDTNGKPGRHKVAHDGSDPGALHMLTEGLDLPYPLLRRSLVAVCLYLGIASAIMAVACVLDWIDAPDAEGQVVEFDDGGVPGGAAASVVSLWTDAR